MQGPQALHAPLLLASPLVPHPIIPHHPSSLTPHPTSQSGHNKRDFFVLPNPTIKLPQPDGTISQSFGSDDASLSAIGGRGAPDSYILSSVPSACSLSARRSGYIEVGSRSLLTLSSPLLLLTLFHTLLVAPPLCLPLI